ncbi:MAG: pirin family protein [Bacteroidales bacterium]|nr:pirin family protein [Bacteroidales bacterium]
MKSIFYKADTRGYANHGWLKTKHTFSFANYFNRDRMHFGLLRVVNDDKVEAGMGFGTHPHENMEIVSIPLKGDLEHMDSMGNKHVIRSGEIQVMSAGTGVTHSEYNANDDRPVEFFQIWVYPREKELKPRYGQTEFDFEKKKNDFTLIVSPDGAEDSLWLYQDVWFSIGLFDKDINTKYNLNKKENGAFIMSIEGEFEVNGTKLERRDAIGLWKTDSVEIKSLSENAKLLIIDVPMDFE